MLPITLKQNNHNLHISNSNTSITNHLQDITEKLDNEIAKYIVDRKTTNVTAIDDLNFKPYHMFDNTVKMADYFLEKIYKIHIRNGIQYLDIKINHFINYSKKIKFTGSRRLFKNSRKLYDFLCKLSLFIEVSIKTPYNNIANAINYFFYKCTSYRAMSKDRILFLENTSFANIDKIATCKDLYRYIENTQCVNKISYEKLKEFSVKIHLDNNKHRNEILNTIATCNSDLRKTLITEYINKILIICTDKDLCLNNELIEIIKVLVASTKIIDANIEDILRKIIIYLQAINNENKYTDISILTNVICDDLGETNEQLLLNICNLTNAQLQCLAVRGYLSYTIKDCSFKGKEFLATGEIRRIKYFNQKTYLGKKNVATTNQQIVTSMLSQISPSPATIDVKNAQHESDFFTDEYNFILADYCNSFNFIDYSSREKELTYDEVDNQVKHSEYDLSNIINEIHVLNQYFDVEDFICENSRINFI